MRSRSKCQKLPKKSKHGKLYVTQEITTFELLLDSAIITLCNKGRKMHSTSSFFKITKALKRRPNSSSQLPERMIKTHINMWEDQKGEEKKTCELLVDSASEQRSANATKKNHSPRSSWAGFKEKRRILLPNINHQIRSAPASCISTTKNSPVIQTATLLTTLDATPPNLRASRIRWIE